MPRNVFQYNFHERGHHSWCVHRQIDGREGTSFVVELAPANVAQEDQVVALDLVLDAFLLGAAIYVADWLSKARRDSPRFLNITLPVYSPSVLANQIVIDRLGEILHWFTGDFWSFGFLPRPELKEPRATPQQFPLYAAKEVALWSGGLDSFLGLLNRLQALPTATQFLLFGTGMNKYVSGKQQSLARLILQRYPNRTELIQVPIGLQGAYHIPKHPPTRSRGFAFILMGAACALIRGQRTLNVYENGVGALNLPLSAAEAGLDHSRAVHPKSLVLMEELLALITGVPVRVLNPFVYHTKAQMCEVMAGDDGLQKMAFRSVSCDKMPRVKGRQCGVCTSCLLRRQALTTAGIIDHTRYAPSGLPGETTWQSDEFLATRQHVYKLAELLALYDPWGALLREYPALIEAEQALITSSATNGVSDMLVRLFRQYVAEWEQFEVTAQGEYANAPR